MEVAPFFVDFHQFLSIFTIFYRFSRFTHFCRDLRTFSANFFGQNSHLRNFTRFLHVWDGNVQNCFKRTDFQSMYICGRDKQKCEKRLKNSQKVYVKEASRFEWMVKASSGRRVWILCLSTSWFLRSSSCEKVSSFILLVVRRWDLYIVSYIWNIYAILKQRKARQNTSV